MGAADGVPGVSGGTIALISGIYERLIRAITAITPERLFVLLLAISPVHSDVSRSRAMTILTKFDVRFLVLLATGIATAVVTVGQLVVYAEANYPAHLFGFFFGLIGASAVVLWREVSVTTISEVVVAVLGFLIAFYLSGNIRLLDQGGPAVVFLAGMCAFSAMILPGVSGSLLLVMLGQYTRMYTTLDAFLNGLVRAATGGGITGLRDPGIVVAIFLCGGAIGVLTVSRIIKRLFETARNTTLVFLVALILGALRAPLTELSTIESFSWTAPTGIAFAIAAAVAGILVYTLTRAVGGPNLSSA